jgi:signal transduction histidine kinase
MALSGEWLSGPLESNDETHWITTRQGLFHVGAQNRLMAIASYPSWLFRVQNGRLELLNERGRVLPLQDEKTNRRSDGALPRPLIVSAAIADRGGSLWIASRGNGVIRLAAAGGDVSANRFTRADGISSDIVRVVFEDREHDLWLGTENGLDRLRRDNVLSLTRRDGMLSDTVTSIAAGNDNSVWLGTTDGLELMADGKHAAYLRGTRILSLLTGGKRGLWAGTTHGLMQRNEGRIFFPRQDAKFIAITQLAEDAAETLWFYDADKGLFRQNPGHSPEVVVDSTLVGQSVTAIYPSRNREIWLGLHSGNVVAFRQGVFHKYSAQDGLPGGEVHGITEDTAGELWVATERGLCSFTGEHFDCRNTQSGLPGERVLWAIPDTNGNMWLGYNIGVARLDLRELRDAKAAGSEKIRWKLYDARDGIENSPDLSGSAPAVLASDGRLWFTTSQGVAVLDPAHLRTNPLPPPVHIVDFEADGREVDLSQPVRLRPLTRNIQFSFTGLSLSDPQNVRFRYRLDGYDSEWRDGGSRRDASYTNLPPKLYVFRVCAANSDGVWNDAGTTLDFTLAPAYFQTLWFRLLCAGAALTVILMLFRVRLQSAQRNMRMRYEERVEERARIAQELHDHLVQEMVGIGMQLEVADALTPENAGAKRPLERAVALSRSAIASGRLTLETLRRRPMTGAAMVDTLRETAEAYAQMDQTPVQYLVEGEERPFYPEIAEEVSEIGQEALRNALKHADGGPIVVRLHFGEASLDLSVRDAGSGVDDAVLRTGIPGHYGLAGMRERAARISAQLVIHCAPSGTTVHVSIPAIRAYQSDSDVDIGYQNRWSFQKLFRRARQEKIK